MVGKRVAPCGWLIRMCSLIVGFVGAKCSGSSGAMRLGRAAAEGGWHGMSA